MQKVDPRFSRVFTDPRFRRKRLGSDEKSSEDDPRFTLPFRPSDSDPFGNSLPTLDQRLLAEDEFSPARTLDSDLEVDLRSGLVNEGLALGAQSANVDYVETSASSETEETIPQGQPTGRLALVNFDWNHIRAVDILALMRSLAPAGGVVLRVRIYPTELYLNRAETEYKYGPKLDDGSEDVGSDEDLMPKTKHELDLRQARENELIRRYERQRMRYFFALIECDTVETASALYDMADGIEYERSSNVIDLRFIPDTMHDFESRTPRDEADAVPLDYKPVSFMTRAFQHSRVQLTWDAGDQERAKKLRKRRFTEDELQDDDFKAYLASSTDSDGSVQRDTEWIQAYRKRLLEGDDVQGRIDSADGPQNERDESEPSDHASDVDMQVTFVPSLAKLGQQILVEHERRETQRQETPWQARLRRGQERERERKRQRRLEHRTSRRMGGSQKELDGNESNRGSDVGDVDAASSEKGEIDDPLLASYSSPQRLRSNEKEHERESDENHEAGDLVARPTLNGKPGNRRDRGMLTIDSATPAVDLRAPRDSFAEDPDTAGKMFSRRPKGKRSRQASKNGEAYSQNRSATFDPDDERFRALYEQHEFAIDPTNPHFSRSKEANALLLRRRLERKLQR
ncbi:hypothetical protein CCYA_CCYA15G3961 [Cyanidiococcus yangmingshanensis]|nr:hypothetical protein CCYA_CCYA15G3961 [Cyanidiococcus yangmingshanensis]